MSKDYRDGYKDGFKDGFEEGKRHATPPYNPIYPSWPGTLDVNKCPVCGRGYNSIDLYVCTNPKCPGRITCKTESMPAINPKSTFGSVSGVVANTSWVAINGAEWSATPALDAEQQSPTYMRTDGWSNK